MGQVFNAEVAYSPGDDICVYNRVHACVIAGIDMWDEAEGDAENLTLVCRVFLIKSATFV